MSDVNIPSETIPAAIAANVTAHPDNLLLVSDDVRLTYREADARSLRLARALLASNVGKGTRVGFLFPNGVDFVLTLLAITRIGALACPFNTFMKPPELAHQLRHSDVQILLTTPGFLRQDYVANLEAALPELPLSPSGTHSGTHSETHSETQSGTLTLPTVPYLREIVVAAPSAPPWASTLESLLARSEGVDESIVRAVEDSVSPADWLCMLYTSGSTAAPKSVVHTQNAFLRRQKTIARAFGYAPGDLLYGPMPWFWLGGISHLLCGFMSGAGLLFEQRFNPAGTLALLERERATHATGWPHYAAAMKADPSFSSRDLGSLRGGNLYDYLVDPTRDSTHYAGGIGMTETAGQHSFQTYEKLPDRLYGATGALSDDVEHRIVDPETGQVLPDGEIGELQVRGFSVMQGYYKREREETFAPDGFFPTGDLGEIREGFYFFTGRLGNMIKTSGANVSPPEVEAEARNIPGVRECIVLGIPDPERGELVAAAVVPEPGASLCEDDIIAALKPRLSAFKLPKVIRFLAAEDIPSLPTGKLDQRGLKRLLADGP